MFGLLPRPARPRRRPAVRLRLEGLEYRDHPDGTLGGDPPTPPPGGGNTSTTNQAPQIVDYDVEEIGNGVYIVRGRVVDESPAGLTVTLGGNTSCAGQTTTTTVDGSFSFVVHLRVDGTDSGVISAKTVDSQGAPSNEPYEYVSPTPP